MKHLVFIINRKSGVDRKKAFETTIEETLDKTRFSHEIAYTEYEKHGTEIAKEAVKNKVYGAIVIGGDGSVNDVLAGLKNSDVVLGIIPKGSGNGMARTLEIPLSVHKAITVINNDKTQNIDVGYANDNIFLSNAGVGFDAMLTAKFRENKKRGFYSYSKIISKYIWNYKPQRWNITIDGRAFQRTAFMINVANGKQLGYDFSIAPNANYTDGLLDVTIIKKFFKPVALLLAWQMKNKTIHNSSYTETFRAKEVKIAAPNLRLLQTDGDAHETQSEIIFRINGKQKIFVP